MLAVQRMSCATASTETCGSEASSSVPLANLGATSWSILVSLGGDFWLLPLSSQSHHILHFSCVSFPQLLKYVEGQATLGNPSLFGEQYSKFY